MHGFVTEAAHLRDAIAPKLAPSHKGAFRGFVLREALQAPIPVA